MEAALAMLGRRACASARVRERVARSFGAEEAARVVDRLTTLGVLDDRAYARRLALGRSDRGYGREHVRGYLLAHGLGDGVVESTLRECLDDDVERRAALHALARFERARAHREPDRRAHDAAARHLLGRGFPLELVRELLST